MGLGNYLGGWEEAGEERNTYLFEIEIEKKREIPGAIIYSEDYPTSEKRARERESRLHSQPLSRQRVEEKERSR